MVGNAIVIVVTSVVPWRPVMVSLCAFCWDHALVFLVHVLLGSRWWSLMVDEWVTLVALGRRVVVFKLRRTVEAAYYIEYELVNNVLHNL